MENQEKKLVVLQNSAVVIPKGKPAHVHVEEKISKDSKPYLSAWMYITEESLPYIQSIVDRSSDQLEFKGFDASARSTIGIRFDFGKKPRIVFDENNKQIKVSSPADLIKKLANDFSITGILDGSYVSKEYYNNETRLNIRLKIDQVKVYGSPKRSVFNPAEF